MHSTYRSAIALLGALAAIQAPIACAATAPALTVLHSLATSDGEYPLAGLAAGSDGNFYGTTSQGGAYGNGTVYQITTSGSLSVLWSFKQMNSGMNLGGASPWASLVQGSDGSFYGTTDLGGGRGNGAIFKITGAGALTMLHSFSTDNSGKNADGEYPYAALVQGSDGNFYGTASAGGASGGGTVFKITPAGAFTTLYSFTGGADGCLPEYGLAAGGDGNFYGTTYAGGGIYNSGTVFKMTPAGALSTLYSFSGGYDGGQPTGALTAGIDGNFYGTTRVGGNGYGEVFKITPSGALTTLYSFTDGTDGAYPLGGLAAGIDGNFYGSTCEGGPNNAGTLFKITPSGVLTALYDFTGPEGKEPHGALVQGIDGCFYGTTRVGGANSFGTVFKLAPAVAGSTYALWNHSGQASLWKIPASGSLTSATFGPYTGWTPAALCSDASGNAYILWTTKTGSASVWSISPSLTVTTSQSFGPYTGWSAQSVAVGPEGNVHVLWNGPSNAAAIYNIEIGGSATSAAYGPYAGWQAQQIAVDYNNNLRVLWTDSAASRASLWNITSSGSLTSQGFGPFAGWQAQSLAIAPGGQPRIVWTCASTKQASIFTIAPNGAFSSQPFGPFNGWSPSGLAVNKDGDSDLMWTGTSNALSLFDIASTGSFTSSGYGPYSGWVPVAIAAGP